jgi:hypothetical protein
MKPRCSRLKPDTDYIEFCELFKLFETLSLYFVNREFIPEQGHVPYFQKGTPSELQQFYIAKWNELENVIEELCKCNYIHYQSKRTSTRVNVTYKNKRTNDQFVLVEGEHGPLPLSEFEIVKKETEIVKHPLTLVDFRNKLYAKIHEK